MTKTEIKNILNLNWALRREKLEERRKAKCQATQEWKLRQQKIKEGLLEPPPKRQKHFIQKSGK